MRLSLCLRMGVGLDMCLSLSLGYVDLGLHMRLELLGVMHGSGLKGHAVLLVLLLMLMLMLVLLVLLLLLLLLLVLVMRLMMLVHGVRV
jgi:hypothetical protein